MDKRIITGVADYIMKKREIYMKKFPCDVKCSVCNTTVTLMNIDEESIWEGACIKCAYLHRIQKRMKAMDTPLLYHSYLPDKFKHTQEWHTLAISTFLKDGWVCLLGSVGVGKTHLAILIALMSAKKAKFIREFDLVQMLEDFKQDTSTIKNMPLVIIDDMGYSLMRSDATLNERRCSVVASYLDYRYSNKLQTIITTNMNIKQFINAYGVYIYDRIDAVGKFIDIKEKSSKRVTFK